MFIRLHQIPNAFITAVLIGRWNPCSSRITLKIGSIKLMAKIPEITVDIDTARLHALPIQNIHITVVHAEKLEPIFNIQCCWRDRALPAATVAPCIFRAELIYPRGILLHSLHLNSLHAISGHLSMLHCGCVHLGHLQCWVKILLAHAELVHQVHVCILWEKLIWLEIFIEILRDGRRVSSNKIQVWRRCWNGVA